MCGWILCSSLPLVLFCFRQLINWSKQPKCRIFLQMEEFWLTSSYWRLKWVWSKHVHQHFLSFSQPNIPTTLDPPPPPLPCRKKTIPSASVIPSESENRKFNTKNQFVEVKLSFGQHFNAILFDFESIYFILHLNRMLSFSLQLISPSILEHCPLTTFSFWFVSPSFFFTSSVFEKRKKRWRKTHHQNNIQ